MRSIVFCSSSPLLKPFGRTFTPLPPIASDNNTTHNATSNTVANPWQAWSGMDTPAWQHHALPGKSATQYAYARLDGRDAIAVSAVSSASLLRQKIHIPAAELGSVKFSWKVPALIAQADMAARETDDSPVRIVLAFEGDRSRFSGKNAMLSELSHTLTGERMPYATLMYVWCNKRQPGSVVINPRTDRIRSMVVESGSKNLRQWLDYQRNIRADFEKAFGEVPGNLISVGIMTDSDNTKTQAAASYGKVFFGEKSP